MLAALAASNEKPPPQMRFGALGGWEYVTSKNVISQLQGSASYGGVKQNADAEAVYKCAEALHSLQDGCDIEQFPFTIRKASSNPSDAVVLDLADMIVQLSFEKVALAYSDENSLNLINSLSAVLDAGFLSDEIKILREFYTAIAKEEEVE